MKAGTTSGTTLLERNREPGQEPPVAMHPKHQVNTSRNQSRNQVEPEPSGGWEPRCPPIRGHASPRSANNDHELMSHPANLTPVPWGP